MQTQLKEPLLSVVIPVHNGAQYIQKTVNRILRQTYRNLEIILVENNSSDDSWGICCRLQQQDCRVRAVQSTLKGTSLARRKGVEEVAGKYIVFSDQDDCYYAKNSLSIMVSAILEDKTQICQFNHYKRIRYGIKIKTDNVKNDKVLTRDELFQYEIGGVLGTEADSCFNTAVWNKIYDAEMLKDAVQNINVSLYFAEDVNLNFWAFINPKTLAVSARTSGVYVWSAGIGFSSRSNAMDALMLDYEQLKPIALETIEKNGVNERVIWDNHLESLYSLRVYVIQLIRAQTNRTEVERIIEKAMAYQYYQNAQRWIKENENFHKWDELVFMADQHTAAEYYDYCRNHMPQLTLKQRIRSLLGC